MWARMLNPQKWLGSGTCQHALPIWARTLSLKSGLALALRRNLGNASSSDIGACLLADVSSKTVCRWEVTLDAALVASALTWHSDMQAGIEEA